MTSLHFHPLRVASVSPDTDESVVVTFDVPSDLRDTFAYRPGQYLTLRADVGGEDLRRSYSICSGLHDGALRVGVRKVAGGRFSGWVNDELQAGAELQVFPPQGHFVLPVCPDAAPAAANDGAAVRPGRHVLGIAAGSGITPILAIMKTVLADEPHSRFTLIYGNRNQKSTMFKEEIEDLKNSYLTRLAIHPVFSREQIDAPLNAGRLDTDKLALFLAALVDVNDVDQAFVCGPLGVIDAAEAALTGAGLPADRLHIERFGAPDASAAQQHAVLPGDAPQSVVTVVRDGLSRQIDFHTGVPSLLDAMAAAGLEAPFSCKSGVCSTCRAKVTSGQVRMDRNFALDKDEVAAGYVLCCQAHPLTERVTVTFDER
ncbi:MAG: phenylacetate-CoA oxygenase/reductase subunit PaaK [Burkholderiales bacterium]|nr:phenylacetate-CoA oxygenase/reductase subunit PaaK [Burkholderiales bacterium]